MEDAIGIEPNKEPDKEPKKKFRKKSGKKSKRTAGDEPVKGREWDARCAARLEQLVPFHPDDEEDGGPNEDIDRFRLTFARRLIMMIGTVEGYWRGCGHGQCRRERMCIAPGGDCANAPPLPDDPDGKLWDEARLEIGLAVREEIARRGLGDE